MLIHATGRGHVPHITPDNLKALVGSAPTALLLQYNSFLIDKPAPAFVQGPHSIARTLALHSREAAGWTQPQIFMGLKDLVPAETAQAGNTDQAVVVSSPSGAIKISPGEFVRSLARHPPDVLILPSDISSLAASSPATSVGTSKSRRSVERSMRYSQEALSAALAAWPAPGPRPQLLLPIAGHVNPMARRHFLDLVGSTPGVLDNVDGFVAHTWPVFDPLRPEFRREDESWTAYGQRVWSKVTSEGRLNSLREQRGDGAPDRKRRKVVALSPRQTGPTPHDLLLLLLGSLSTSADGTLDRGIDLFVSSWEQGLSNVGVAADFEFPVRSDVGTGKDIGVDLFEPEWATSHALLSSSPLATSLPAALQQPTRAYLNHLLETHEMTSHVLLALHNTHMMRSFALAVEEVLASGGIEALQVETDRFFEAYEPRGDLFEKGTYECELRAAEGSKRVERLRGKGSVGRAAAAAAAGVTPEVGTPDVVKGTLDGPEVIMAEVRA